MNSLQISETIINFAGVLLGAIIGATTSIFTTILVQKRQEKQYKVKYIREKTDAICAELSSHLSKSIPVVQLMNESDLILSQEVFKERASNLALFLDENDGVFNLYITKEINDELIKLRSILFKITSSQDSIPFSTKDLSDNSTLVGSMFFLETKINEMLKKYLGIEEKK